MVNVPKLGAALKRFAGTKRAYELLDASSETAGSTWLAGGCWVLAEAVHALLPGSELVAVVEEGRPSVPQHVVVEYRGWYLDADGASGASKLLARWRDEEGLVDPVLHHFQRERAVEAELVCPIDLLRRLREALYPVISKYL